MRNGKQGNACYPVFLDLARKRCLVVGGGQVALRKVSALLESGADVQVISPEACVGLLQLADAGQVKLVRRQYREGDLEGVFLAVAATDDPGINKMVSAEARSRRCLVNVVDDPANSDFIVPSCLRRGDITVAVSTGGASPALARKLRTRLEGELGEEYALLAGLVGGVRGELLRQGIHVDAARWQEALDLDRLLVLLKNGESEKARMVLLRNLNIEKIGKSGR